MDQFISDTSDTWISNDPNAKFYIKINISYKLFRNVNLNTHTKVGINLF